MEKKKVFSKILAVILASCLVLTTFSGFSVFAKGTDEAITENSGLSSIETNITQLNTEGDLSLDELQTAQLDLEDIPEVVNEEKIAANGHVNRLRAQENSMSSVVFQNRDGTKTVYNFNYDVKYRDESGQIKDKSNKIVRTVDGDYTNPANDINTYFPKKLNKNKGVELKFDDYTVEMSPDINGNSGASRQTGHDKYLDPAEYVQYPDVFDEGISLRYTPTFEGYKEDIVLNEYTGINEFSFILYTDGLSLVMGEDGLYSLVDPLTGEIKAKIGDLVVYDSNSAENAGVIIDDGYFHQYNVKTVKQDSEYLITVVVDNEYLTASDRVYPVYVDPTIAVSGSGINKTIQDVPVYNNGSNITSGNREYNVVGFQGTYGTGRTVMKFPGLILDPTYESLASNQITSLQLHMYEGSGYENTSRIEVWQYNGSIWNENTAECDNIGWSSTHNNFTHTDVSSSGWQTFDLTSMVATWKVYPYAQNSELEKGIMLINGTSETLKAYGKHFLSTESSYKPYLSYTYNPISYTTLVAGTTLSGNLIQGGEYWYRFVATESRSYAFYTSGSTDTYGELYQVTTLLQTNNDSANGSNFCIIQNLTAGVEYYLKVRGNLSSISGQYSVAVCGNWSVQLTNSNADINNHFDRIVARQYMDKWAKAYNTAQYETQTGADCANYTSQCLYAGGMSFVGAPSTKEEAADFETDRTRWYYCPEFKDTSCITLNKVRGYSYTWTSVKYFQNFWGKKADGTIGQCYQYIEYSLPSLCMADIAYLANILQPGDVLQYTSDNQAHNMIVSGTVTDIGNEDILYSAHTGPRLDDSFKSLVLQDVKYSGCKIHIIRIAQN